ncbi:sulfoxide reductase heme-binding subunit YedZ [Polynucleobacter wuianus]|uniref:Protein-methionine-sulfoxide reductase heme-binding subunit MsrQ n=1 Tax=Polynucleobacter wuianus TaxID=1743168 RepID=A0A191UDI4_9BURK|nr:MULTISPECIES: protein-methionine-sulfoxide reductase heme-binding subunit MsrQ [Polynucleobacter]ANI98955.1 sulfoxide reductase heme-binding subunit YedZ [Polynucleobacter wuianus]MBU3552488.1 sulfoxide reductase heme-binding subunit YedZ [Polynucleobacter sp. MWH-Post4-6-1]
MKFLKSILFLASLIPLGRLLWLGYLDNLGANPIELITRSTGTWALVFLCITLAMTPLRLITGSGMWIRMRRMFGLFCFFYASIHFSIWLLLDQSLDLQAMVHDVLKRPFITMGFLSLVLLMPLAVTSNAWAVKKLGRRWSLLHKLIYVIALTVIAHYWWHKAGKNDLETVSIYAGVISLLLLVRLPFIKDRLRITS